MTDSNQHVLVAVSLEAASVVAMQRALFLARSFGVELRLLHVSDPEQDPPSASAILEWAAVHGVILGAESIDLRCGEVPLEIARAAQAVRPKLLVIGGRHTREDVPGHVTRYVTCHASVPVLVASGSSELQRILAASDLRIFDHPVLRAADSLALATSAHATALHNVEPEAPQFPARAQELGDLVERLPSTDAALLTREQSTAVAIEMAARMVGAEIVAVGVRNGSGATLLTLLQSYEQSIMSVPLPDG